MELEVKFDEEVPSDGSSLGGQISFLIRNRAVGGVHADSNGEWRSGLAELSGGQRTLLNISLLLALAKYCPSAVLLLDEVQTLALASTVCKGPTTTRRGSH